MLAGHIFPRSGVGRSTLLTNTAVYKGKTLQLITFAEFDTRTNPLFYKS